MTSRTGQTSQPSTVSRPRGERMPPDPSWRRLYRAGAWAAAVYVTLLLAAMVLLATAPLPPSSGAAVLEYIDTHGVVYLVELVCFVGLSVPALVVFSAWAVALKHVDKSMALIGGLFGVASEITALAVGSSPQSLNGGLVVLSTAYRSATTADERAGLASAADAIIATTNAMPWAGVLTAAGILALSLIARRGPVPRRRGRIRHRHRSRRHRRGVAASLDRLRLPAVRAVAADLVHPDRMDVAHPRPPLHGRGAANE